MRPSLRARLPRQKHGQQRYSRRKSPSMSIEAICTEYLISTPSRIENLGDID